MTRTYVYDFEAPPEAKPAELTRLLGGKGANLVMMASGLGLPVPPGFTITTAACKEYLDGNWPDGLDDELRAHMRRLANRVGRQFGGPGEPLLVSVRSGAPVSMPGMMDTILNLGLNDATADGLAMARGPEFAADCLRRFRQGYRDVIGAEDVPDNPWVQLRNAIEAVFRSWNSDRAVAYRRHEHIPDDLGTAVTVQAMVFGNGGADSGTGVMFTRNPSTGEATLYGDIMFDAQGEDVVAGTHATEPISVLDDRMPDAAAELRRYAAVLEHHLADLADVEFTIDSGRLWLLQVRTGKRSRRAALRMAIDMAEDDGFPLSREEAIRRVAGLLADPPRVFLRAADVPSAIATGLPASPGVATGGIVTSSNAAVAASRSGQPAILVRSETSPEDVAGMAESVGVLTARGGLASHAAVVARGWGIPAVVGVEGLRVGDESIAIDGRMLWSGEQITIDGTTGEVFLGELEGKWEVAPEAATLLEWATEIGVEIMSGAPEAGDKPQAADTAAQAEISADDIARALAVKGTVAIEQLSQALVADAAVVASLVDELVVEKIAEQDGGQVRLSAAGKLKAAAAFAADRAKLGLGDEQMVQLLHEFHAFDVRMKEVVTGWQIRDVDGEHVLNDHSDAVYDERIIDELAVLNSDLIQWLSPMSSAVHQVDAYRTRLGRALERTRSGDQRYVASPRVDSYHSVWFELHEHLIRLAGRRRSDEAAAGRA